MTPPNDRQKRILLVAGTATYRYAHTFADGLESLDAVPEALKKVAASLSQLGYAPLSGSAESFLLNPDSKTLSDAIRAVAQTAHVAIIYYTGHGLTLEDSPYYVLTADADGDRMEDTALRADHIVSLLHRREKGRPAAEQPHVLVILDCCFSGQGGIETLQASLQHRGNPNVWVLASAGNLEWAQQGRFAHAFTTALEKTGIGHSQMFLDPNEVRIQIDAELGAMNVEQRASLFPPQGRLAGTPPAFFPSPVHVPAVTGLTIQDQEWVARLRAAPKDKVTSGGLYVAGSTGRVRAVQDLEAWMRGPEHQRLAVVTGSPGSGKSTLLALPALLADPHRAASLLDGSPQGSLPSLAAKLLAGLPVLGIYARGMDSYQVTAEIAAHYDLDGYIRDPRDLLADLGNTAGIKKVAPQIIVIDAIDESVNPRELLDDLLLPLAHCPDIKILIGTRRHLVHPYEGADAIPADLLIDLDDNNYRDPTALAGYSRALLLATHEPEIRSPYREAPEDDTAVVAQAIADRATVTTSNGGKAESFLLAQLLALSVRSRQRVPALTQPSWADQLPAGIDEAFNEDLANLGTFEARARALLTALAWAQGPGLPWESIWTRVAQDVANTENTYTQTLGSGDVRWLLHTRGRYIVEDLGPGHRSVFRPFHELLTAYLRGEPGRDSSSTDVVSQTAWRVRRQRTEAAITRALLDSVPTGADGRRDWPLAHPYLHSYLVRHAHAAGPETLALLVSDLDYLAVADPTTLTPLLIPNKLGLGTTARAYRRARPLLGADPGENAAYLQEAFIAETGVAPGRQSILPSYHTFMARARRDDSLLALTGHVGRVTSVAIGRGANDRPLLASGGEDGTVRLWDPETGSPTCEPLTGHIGRVVSVSFGTRADGHPLLASAGWDGTVRLWDPEFGTPASEPLTGHAGRVASVAFGTSTDGYPILASAGDDGSVRIWDPVTATPLSEHISRGRGATSVALGAQVDGHLLLASGFVDRTVRLWRPDTGSLESETITGHSSRVASVAFGTRANGHPLLASAGQDGTVRIWDPDSGAPFCAPFIHSRNVSSVAFGTRADGHPLLASAGEDGAVRIWDPDSGTPVRAPLIHGHSVSSIAFGTLADDHPFLASAGNDGTVRIWDLENVTVASEKGSGHRGRVVSVAFGAKADGRPVLASAGDDGIVQLWDPHTGAPVSEPLSGHVGRVAAVAFGARTDGSPLMATGGGRDGTVRIWNVDTGVLVGAPLTGHAYSVTSVAFGFRADGVPVLCSGGRDGTVRIWDANTGASIGKPFRHDYRKLASFGWKRMMLRGSTSDGPLPSWSITGEEDLVASIAFGTLSTGREVLASAGWDRKVRLWDLNTGAPVGEAFTGHAGQVTSVTFGVMADSLPVLASGSDDGTIRFWDPETGALTGEPLVGHAGRVTSIAFGTQADGIPLLVSAGDDCTVRIWDPNTGLPATTIHRRTSVNSVALDGSCLAIGDDEGVVVVEVTMLMSESSQVKVGPAV